MKKKINAFVLIIFSALTVLWSASCGDCKQSEYAWADLITNGLSMVTSQQINVGDAVNMAIQIKNCIDQSNDCGTNTAGDSHYNFDLYHSPDSSAKITGWTKVGTATYSALEILAGNSWDDQNNITFNVPGYFYLMGISNSIQEEVIERNYTNNDKNADFPDSVGKSTLPNYILHVHENSLFQNKVAKGEKFEVVTFHNKGNMIKSKSAFFDPKNNKISDM